MNKLLLCCGFCLLSSVSYAAQYELGSSQKIGVRVNIVNAEDVSLEKCLEKYNEFCENIIINDNVVCDQNGCYTFDFKCVYGDKCYINKIFLEE